MSHPYNLREIQKNTGLKYEFLRRIVKEIPELSVAYAVKGQNNALYFETNGLVCFREIAKMKEEGYTLPSIRSQVITSLPNQAKEIQNSPADQQQNQPTQPQNNILLKLLEEAQGKERENYQIALSAKNSLIEQQQATIQALENGLKLLTDGRPPEMVRQEAKEREGELLQLRQVKHEVESLKKEQESLLILLKNCRWYQGKKRKTLYLRLAELTNKLAAE